MFFTRLCFCTALLSDKLKSKFKLKILKNLIKKAKICVNFKQGVKNRPLKANLASVANYQFKANFATKTKHEVKLNFAILICLVILKLFLSY